MFGKKLNLETGGMYLYLIFDKLAERSSPVFEAVNNAVAVRSVKRMRIMNPEDFELRRVGFREEKSGRVRLFDPQDVIEVIVDKAAVEGEMFKEAL